MTDSAFVEGGFFGDTWHAVAARYWKDPSNDVPFLLASRVASHMQLHGYLFGTWESSDRPPLQSGFTLFLWPLWGHRQPSYQLLGTALQTMWVPAVWVLLRVRGYSSRRSFVVCLGTALTGVIFVNSVYVWPKMLAGAFILSALAILVSLSEDDQWPGIGILVTALVTLGLLAHGGAVFSVIALIPFAYHFRRRMSGRSVLSCVAAAAAVYAPWVAFQRFVDPPGDRLLKWQLAGLTGVDKRGVLQTLRQQYGSLSPWRVLVNKWDNVETLVANPNVWQHEFADPAWHGFLGYARGAQLNDLMIAVGPLLLGLFALLVPSARSRLTSARPLLGFVVLSLFTWVVLIFGVQQVHTDLQVNTTIEVGSFAATVLLIGLFVLAVTMLPRIYAGLVLGSSVMWFAICWVPGLGFAPGSLGPQSGNLTVDVAMATVLAASISAALALCWVEFRRQPRPLQSLRINQIV